MTEPAAPYEYSLCGLRTSSAVRLPELPPWQGGEVEADLQIILGPVPDRLENVVLETPALQIDAQGRTRFAIEGVGAYLIEEGSRITLAPNPRAHDRELRLFLLGTPFGVICHQRGLTPLHAAGVEIDGEAVLLAGASGIGKSTLSNAFHRRGYRLMSDDVTPVRLVDGGAEALPAVRRVRLWQDSADAAGLDVSTLERCRDGLDKFSRTGLDGFVSKPLPVRALITLQRMPPHLGEAFFSRLRGREAVACTSRQVYRARSLEGLCGAGEAMVRTARTAAAIPLHLMLARPLRFEDLDRHVDLIVETVRAAR